MLRAETGIDYLTATLPLGDRNEQAFLLAGHMLQKEAQNEGNVFKPQEVLGYDGTLCGPVFVGTGVQGSMVRISSQRAFQGAQALRPVQPRITRIDLQVTVFYEADSEVIVRRHYEEARQAAYGPSGLPKRGVERHEKIDGGYTVNIGSRSYQHFGRIYDKYKESKDNEYAGAIRYEVELKGKPARQAYALLEISDVAVHEQIASFVAEWFGKRGVRPSWLFEVGKLDLVPVKRETSDTARRLKWLRTQVRHTVKVLLETVDATVILEALGFLDPDTSAQYAQAQADGEEE